MQGRTESSTTAWHVSDSQIVEILKNKAALTTRMAEEFAHLADDAIRERGVFRVALAGGSTPKASYQLLAGEAFAGQIDWQRVQVFWGDERMVPAEHADSNYRMAKEALLDKVPIPTANIYAMRGELKPEEAAEDYEHKLGTVFGGENVVFDLVLLGMGTDGHTASLFPESSLLDETVRWVASVPEPTGNPPVPRITLTLPVINQARLVLFLVSGSGKRRVVKAILDDPLEAAKHYPAARVHPRGKTIWFYDMDLGTD